MERLKSVWKHFQGSYYPVRVVNCQVCGVEIEYPYPLCHTCLRKQSGPAPEKLPYSSMPHE